MATRRPAPSAMAREDVTRHSVSKRSDVFGEGSHEGARIATRAWSAERKTTTAQPWYRYGMTVRQRATSRL